MLLTRPFQGPLFSSLAGWAVLLIACLLLLPSKAFTFQSFEDFSSSREEISPVRVTAITDPKWVKPGKSFDLYLLVDLTKGWHIYSLKAQSEGESLATEIHFDENIFQTTDQWREPKPAIALDGALDKVVEVHTGSVRFRQNLRVPGDLSAGEYAITGRVEFRACDNKICALPREIGFETRFRVSKADSGR